jgi:hypothetical protein
MDSVQLVESFKTLEKKLRAVDEEMVILLKQVKEQRQDPIAELFAEAVKKEVARLTTPKEKPFRRKREKPKKRGTPREFSMDQKLEILSDYESAIASGVRGAGKKALAKHGIHSSAYVTIWRKELARKTAPEKARGLGHSNIPVNF